ncbi:MAG: cation:proton antiporter [Methylococcaceae bacterium]|nr:MAG: cation:proton antiporter [Methylococcaceae bacterium]
MNHHQLIVFFGQIGLMIGIAWIFGYAMRRLNQPVVLGELLAGVLIGPTVLGMFQADGQTGWLPDEPAIASIRGGLLKVGMLFFMFAAGLEVNLKAMGRRKTSITLASLLGGALPFGLGFGGVLLFPDWWGTGDTGVFLALFVGTALSISALPVIARILIDTGLMQRDVGAVVMAAAMINDLLGWSLFAVILRGIGQGQQLAGLGTTLAWVAGFSVLVLAFGHWVVQPLLRRANFSEHWPLGLLSLLSALIFIAATGAEFLGIHGIFGAFLVGVALGQGSHQEEERCIHRLIQPFALGFFAPLYFVSVGINLDFSAHFDGRLVFLVCLIASVGKILGGGLGAWLGGMTVRHAMAVGVALNARGAIEIILASIALENHLITPPLFVALSVMAFATSLACGPLLKRLVQ